MVKYIKVYKSCNINKTMLEIKAFIELIHKPQAMYQLCKYKFLKCYKGTYVLKLVNTMSLDNI